LGGIAAADDADTERATPIRQDYTPRAAP
jgi:hypothetical protein